MIDYFLSLNHSIQALIATLFTWGITAFGASLVFFFKSVKKNLMDAMLGIAGGVMISASFFSLLSPAVEMSRNLNINTWLTVTIGFISGGILLFIGDKTFDLLDKKYSKEKINKKSSIKRSLMLIFSITLHNIPEGMAVGVAFGSLAYNLRREGFSRKKAFIYGSLSGIVEPISGVIGALLVLKIRLLLPFLLAFAAGAMIYVVVEEIIPESQTNEKKDLMALFTLIGFSLMMVLDVALG